MARHPNTLERPEDAHAWELRGAWAKRRKVRLTLTANCLISTVVGTVETVAATGAYVIVDGWHVPTYTIQAIGKPTVQDQDAYEAEMKQLRKEALA